MADLPQGIKRAHGIRRWLLPLVLLIAVLVVASTAYAGASGGQQPAPGAAPDVEPLSSQPAQMQQPDGSAAVLPRVQLPSQAAQPANAHVDLSGPSAQVRGPIEPDSGVSGADAPGGREDTGGVNGADHPGGRTD